MLEQNFPNPFNPNTAISYQLTATSFVRLAVYDVLGREIATLVDAFQDAGLHSVRWDGSSSASGTYFYRLEIGGSAVTRRMVLMR
jgi:hypothetical protein